MFQEETMRKTIAQLDEDVPREGAAVKMIQYGGGPDEGQIIANRLGYLRLGIEFLKAAFAQPVDDDPKNANEINVDIDYLCREDSTINFDWFELTESIPEDRKPSWGDRFVPIIMLIILLLV